MKKFYWSKDETYVSNENWASLSVMLLHYLVTTLFQVYSLKEHIYDCWLQVYFDMYTWHVYD